MRKLSLTSFCLYESKKPERISHLDMITQLVSSIPSFEAVLDLSVTHPKMNALDASKLRH